MIPKIIHHCWFGPKAKNQIALRCMDSWKEFCPDYEFIEWTEDNSAKFQNRFYKQAYAKKQFAFVADCIRAQALAEYGGMYLDTDMLVVQPLDSLLTLQFFTGFEVPGRAAYGLFGGIAKHRFFVAMSSFYSNNYFNPYSLPVITHTFKSIINEQSINSKECIFNSDYFYCLPYQDKDKDFREFLTQNSMAVHLWNHSWKESQEMTAFWYFKNLFKVANDTVFKEYPFSYYKRYTRGFARQLFYKLFKKRGS